MKKFVIVVFIFVILFLLGGGGYYYFLRMNGSNWAHGVVYPISSRLNMPLNWFVARIILKSTCKEIPPFINRRQKDDYLFTLFESLEKGLYDVERGYVGLKNYSTGITNRKKNTPTVPDDASCWFVYIGNTKGSGKIAFESETGNIEIMRVKNYPSGFIQ